MSCAHGKDAVHCYGCGQIHCMTCDAIAGENDVFITVMQCTHCDHDDWAEQLVHAAAWEHVGMTLHTGFTTASSGRARCGACSWVLVARLDDTISEAHGRFALFALAQLGFALAEVAAHLTQVPVASSS